jgi:polyisoprenoid-binding protein YceI
MNPCLPLGVALLLIPLTALPAQAASAAYELDPVHTRVMVAVEHAGFSKALGTVSGSSGHLQFDPEDWTTAKLEVSVPLQRLDLGDEKWNKAVLARNLLDVEEFPTASFVSTRIEPIDPQHASVYGTLTLHGVAKEVKLEVTFNALKRHPLPPFRRTAGFSATAMLSRAEFGIDAWKSVIGDSVELRLEVEATRTRKDTDGNDQHDEERDEEPPPATPTPTTEPAKP